LSVVSPQGSGGLSRSCDSLALSQATTSCPIARTGSITGWAIGRTTAITTTRQTSGCSAMRRLCGSTEVDREAHSDRRLCWQAR
jgi:hypothetical protein